MDHLDVPLLVHQFVSESARSTPDAPAVIEPGRRATYAELDALANRFALALLTCGVGKRDRVILALENSIEQVACYFGALKAGAVAVPLPQGPKNDRLVRAVDDCAPAAAVLDTASAQQLASAGALATLRGVWVHDRRRLAHAPVSDVSGDWADLASSVARLPDSPPTVPVVDVDPAAIIYTSGSTGEPRGVLLTHLNIRTNTTSIVTSLRLTAADRVMCVLPFYYVYGLSLLHTHMFVGGSVVLDNRFAFPNVVLAAMQEQRVTGFAGVPSSFALLLHRSNLTSMEFPHLRYVTQAGGGMPPARILEWLDRGPKVPFFVMYGATEASARLTCLPPEDLRRKLGSIGRPIPNVEIVIVKGNGDIAQTGETGELVARGANIAAGYWNDAEETRQRFGPLGYRTGDLGYADDEAFLYLVGRRHDMIKVGAHRVSAKEIEDVIHEFPGIHEAAVVGIAHTILGEAPVAFIAMREGDTADEQGLRAFCHARLAPHKMPTRFIFRSDLPKIGVGKIDKATLRSLLSGVEVEP